MTVVLDADVVIAALDADDAQHRKARRLFTAWHRDGVARHMSVVNLSEVLVGPSASRSRLQAAREAIALLGVAAHRPTELIAVEAARLRGRHPVSLPDAYLLATARHLKAEPVSFDQRLQRAAKSEGLLSR